MNTLSVSNIYDGFKLFICREENSHFLKYGFLDEDILGVILDVNRNNEQRVNM